MYWILFIGIALASWLVQANLKNKFEKYSKIPIDGGLTGRDIAVKMLHDNGIYDVEVVSTSGSLTDHYNPANKTVNLSEDVYDTCSVAAAAVAAHECGHAVQHARGYAPLTLRSQLVPVVQFASTAATWVIILGLVILASTQNELLCWIGVGMIAMSALFSLVTLPVELDASRRAGEMLLAAGVIAEDELPAAKKVLSAAALTYLASLLTSFVYFLRFLLYVLSVFGRRERR